MEWPSDITRVNMVHSDETAYSIPETRYLKKSLILGSNQFNKGEMLLYMRAR